jgi:hypothetical protein
MTVPRGSSVRWRGLDGNELSHCDYPFLGVGVPAPEGRERRAAPSDAGHGDSGEWIVGEIGRSSLSTLRVPAGGPTSIKSCRTIRFQRNTQPHGNRQSAKPANSLTHPRAYSRLSPRTDWLGRSSGWPMRPNFALHRLVEGVRLNEGEVRALRGRFGAMQSGLAQAFPPTRMKADPHVVARINWRQCSTDLARQWA